MMVVGPRRCGLRIEISVGQSVAESDSNQELKRIRISARLVPSFCFENRTHELLNHAGESCLDARDHSSRRHRR